MVRDFGIPQNVNITNSSPVTQYSGSANLSSSSSINTGIGQKREIELTDAQKQEMQLLGITDPAEYIALSPEQKQERFSSLDRQISSEPRLDTTRQSEQNSNNKFASISDELNKLGINPNSSDWAGKTTQEKLEIVFTAITNAAKAEYSEEEWAGMSQTQKNKATNVFIENAVKKFVPDWDKKSKDEKLKLAIGVIDVFKMSEMFHKPIEEIIQLKVEGSDEFTKLQAEYKKQGGGFTALSLSLEVMSLSQKQPRISSGFAEHLRENGIDFNSLSTIERSRVHKSWLYDIVEKAGIEGLEDPKDKHIYEQFHYNDELSAYLKANNLEDTTSNRLRFLNSKGKLNPTEQKALEINKYLYAFHNNVGTKIKAGEACLEGSISIDAKPECFNEDGTLNLNNIETIKEIVNMFKTCREPKDYLNLFQSFDQNSQDKILTVLLQSQDFCKRLGVNLDVILDAIGLGNVSHAICPNSTQEAQDYVTDPARLKAHDDEVTDGGKRPRSKEYTDAMGSITEKLDTEHASSYTNTMAEIDQSLYESSYNYGMQRDDWEDYSNSVRNLISNNENIDDNLKSQYLQWASDIANDKLTSSSSSSNSTNSSYVSSEPTTNYAQNSVVNYSSATKTEQASMQKVDFLFNPELSDSEKRKEFDKLDPAEKDRILRNLDPNTLAKMPGGSVKTLCEAYPFLIEAFVQAGKGQDILSSGVSKVFDETVKLMKKHDPKALIEFMVEHPAQFNSNTNAWASRVSGKDKTIQHTPISFRA